ncbi:MAG: histidine kinase [Bacteroidota bacterium]
MRRTLSAIPILIAFAALMVVATGAFLSRYTEQSKFRDAENESRSFGGNDWVVWEDGEAGVVARRVHPLIQSNPLLRDGYIKAGDVLKRIDYQDIYRAEVARRIVANAAPGTVLLVQVERGSGEGLPSKWLNLFIENSFQPHFTIREEGFLWALLPWMLILGAFLALVSTLTIFPIIRPALRENWPLLGVLVLSFIVFGALGLRHLNLLVSNDYTQAGFERLFTWLFSILLPLYGGFALFMQLRKWMRGAILVSIGVVGIISAVGYQAIFQRSFALYGDLLPDFVLFVFLAHVFFLLLLSVNRLWRGRSRMDKLFHILSILYAGPMLAVYFLAVLDGSGSAVTNDFTHFLVFGAMLIPLISTAASQLKFGRVSLVLTNSIQYLVFAVFILILYYALRASLLSLGLKFKYQAYLELAILLVLVLGIRFVLRINRDRFRRYFITAQQEKRDRIDAFISRIPQYSSSQKLTEDLGVALKEYFGTGLVTVRMEGEAPVGDDVGIDESLIDEVYNYLRSKGLYWARNRQMAYEPLPEEKETAMLRSPYSLANPITVNENIHGLLLLGRKRRGVYNLEDLEVISRMVQQTQLTLGVLHLLERERILVQKNLEANLTALRSQINPHFLFNTLNTISALVHEDPDDAEEAVEKLAFIFRYTLKHSDRTFVRLKEEMSLVRTYLDIEKIRFGERLQLHFAIDPVMEEVELPAFVMQTIVENCIKHGIAKITGQGHIHIAAHAVESMLEVEIKDNGPGIDLSRITASTGLNNILTRLEKIYELKNLLYFENTGNGTKVTIKIPLENEQIQSADRG